LRVGLDSDVIIELVSEAGIRHEATLASYEALVASGTEFVVTDHALLEAFSVLSRSPAPVGVAPKEAERMLRETLGGHIIAPIRAGLAWETIRHTLDRGFAGGRVYDAVIALATYEAGAQLLITWNVKHFLTIAPAGLEIRHP
jgi:predicted nucleic acid-binding protein